MKVSKVPVSNAGRGVANPSNTRIPSVPNLNQLQNPGAVVNTGNSLMSSWESTMSMHSSNLPSVSTLNQLQNPGAVTNTWEVQCQ